METRATWFVEGVWNGDFPDGRFHRTECFFGSGAVVENDSVVFVSAADTVDSLFYAERNGTLSVSNSLSLLLAGLGDSLSANGQGYCEWLDSALKGIFDYQRSLDTSKGTIQRLLFRNLRIGPSGLTEQDKPLPPRFSSYEDYVGYLERAYAGIAKNARDPGRSIDLEVFSTQSRGYDTTAVNAIASKHGLDRVFTCVASRDKAAFVTSERAGQASDDGTLIGQSLGFECTPIDRLSFRRRFPDEELYYAGHHEAADVNLREINDHVPGVAVLLTGVRGEVWYGEEFYRAKKNLRSDSLMKFDMAGHGLSEVRLHVGLILLPFPFLGAQRQEDIHAITRSKDMDGARLGQAYDRPIPRRIAEERGVPRHLFGQAKLNTTVAFPKPPVPFEPTLRREFLRSLARSSRRRRWQAALLPVVHAVNQMLYYCSPKRYRALYYLERVASRILRRPVRFPLLLKSLNGALFCFCVNRAVNRYARILDTPGGLVGRP